jgi:nitroimidazol reductase NimA-like FMN-containing flavoprotein (pyridoxamine 5'-phosphate oxidase superfamily)
MNEDDGPPTNASSGMSRERLEEFLAGIPFAALASLRRSRTPFVVPLGFLFRDNSIFFAIREGRSGVQRLRRDGRVSITVYDHEFPPSWVVIEGVAGEVPDSDHALKRAIVTPFLSRQGIDVDEYLRFWTGGKGRVVFEVPIDRLVSMDGKQMSDIDSLDALRQRYDQTLGQSTG